MVIFHSYVNVYQRVFRIQDRTGNCRTLQNWRHENCILRRLFDHGILVFSKYHCHSMLNDSSPRHIILCSLGLPMPFAPRVPNQTHKALVRTKPQQAWFGAAQFRERPRICGSSHCLIFAKYLPNHLHYVRKRWVLTCFDWKVSGSICGSTSTSSSRENQFGSRTKINIKWPRHQFRPEPTDT